MKKSRAIGGRSLRKEPERTASSPLAGLPPPLGLGVWSPAFTVRSLTFAVRSLTFGGRCRGNGNGSLAFRNHSRTFGNTPLTFRNRCRRLGNGCQRLRLTPLYFISDFGLKAV